MSPTPTSHAPSPGAPLPNRPATAVTGDLACRGCGYRIASFGALPRCPMCGGSSWHVVVWRPFSGRPSSRRDAPS